MAEQREAQHESGAHQKVQHILSTYQPEALPAELDAEIVEEILERAKKSLIIVNCFD